MISIADRLLHRSFIGLIDVITKDLLSPDLFIMKQLGFVTNKKKNEFRALKGYNKEPKGVAFLLQGRIFY